MATAQTHFIPVWTGNGLDHMNIYVTSVTVDGVSLTPGSEIGVFDGIYCVGAAVRPNVIQNYIEIRVSMDDPTTTGVDGYTTGNPISFKLWNLANATEYENVVATYTLGNPVFQPGATAMVSLSYTTAPVNNPPVAVVSGSQVVNEGQSVTVSGANSFDPDGNQLTYSWTVSPTISGLSLNTAVLSFVAPEVTVNTTYNFTLVVNDGQVNSQPAYTWLLVKDVNKPPVITGQTAVSTNENTSIVLNIGMLTYTDPDPGQTHTLFAYPGNNYLLSGLTVTPIPGFSGTLSVPVRISDGIDMSNVYNLVITVVAVNNTPQFTSNPVLSVVAGTTYLYFISATDPDGDDMTIAPVTIPAWLTFDMGPVNGEATLVGTPQTEQVGVHPVSISLTDGTIETPVIQSFNITVQPATLAPVLITSALQKAYANSAYTSLLEFYDADSDSVLVSLQNAPAWLSLEGAINGVARLKMAEQHAEVNLIGTPSTSSVGTIAITILFTDKTNNRSKLFPLQVLTPNTPPVASTVEVVTNEDEQVLVVLQGTDAETPYGLIYELLSQPEHGSLSQISARIYIYTPNENFFGTDEFEYRVKESGSNPLYDDAEVEITINPVNDPPVINAPNRYFTSPEGEDIPVPDIEFSDDLDGDNASELELVSLFGPFNGLFNLENHTYTPDVNFYGSDLIFLVARELGADQLESEPLMVWFNIEMVNQTPYFSIRDIVVHEDSQVTFIPVVSDREADIEELEYNIVVQPTNGTLVIEGLTFTYTPDPDWYGEDYIVFQAKDFHGDWTPDLELFVHCAPINDAPVALSATVDANGSASFIINFTDLVSDVDNNLSELTIEFIVTDEDGVGMGMFPSTIVQGANNMTFTYTSLHENTVDYILYRVFDLQNTSLPSMLTINNLPGTKAETKTDLFLAKGDFVDITWGDTLEVVFTLVVSANIETAPELIITNAGELSGQLIDIQLLEFIQGNPLVTYRALYIAPHKSFEDDKPSGNATGVIFDKVGFKGTGSGKDTPFETNVDSISIGNLQTLVPTTIHPIEWQYITEGESAQADIFYTDPDTPDDEIEWNIEVAVEGVSHEFSLIEPGLLSLQITPPVNFYGSMVVSVTATDDTTSTAREFVIEIEGLNMPPEINMVDSIFFMANTQRVVSLLISDRETSNSQLNISFEADPSNAVSQLIYSLGDLTIVPASGFSSNFCVNVTVSDGVNETTHQLKLKYKASNAMPMLLPISTVTTLEDTPKSITIIPMDADAQDILEATTESSNQTLVSYDGITIDPPTALPNVERTITFTPAPDRHGDSDITVFVNDGFKSIAQQFTLRVLPVNDPPSLVEVDDQEMYNNQALVLALSATDIDSYIFTFSAQSSNEDLEFEVVDNLLTITVLNGYHGTTDFTVTVADDSLATATQTIPLVVHDGTSAPIIDGLSVLIYPNPATDRITIRGIDSRHTHAMVNVYNVHGQLVLSRRIENGSDNVAVLDISRLPQGVYMLQIQVNAQYINTKIIKK